MPATLTPEQRKTFYNWFKERYSRESSALGAGSQSLSRSTQDKLVANRRRMVDFLKFSWRFQNAGSLDQTHSILSLRRTVAIAYAASFKADPIHFGIPGNPGDTTFYFLPSDADYCGPLGPTDLQYDPRFAPTLNDEVILAEDFVGLPSADDTISDTQLADDAVRPPPYVPSVADFAGPERILNHYNQLRRMGSSDKVNELIEACKSRGTRMRRNRVLKGPEAQKVDAARALAKRSSSAGPAPHRHQVARRGTWSSRRHPGTRVPTIQASAPA
ncbi:MAG: hypothetical protein BJ554DRAFT_3430 [Olpidium bornovanus]|uniref:Uncharacterized protein n=1 Tax=Olpidium bornovanus TaxID=278681 RepID=A0A8H8DLJ6_9FUNG|nr:MAG: hypothetical protein BJ554DRAFT_3430 [Olpidium bornovanus]